MRGVVGVFAVCSSDIGNFQENGYMGKERYKAIDEMAGVLYNNDRLGCEIVDSVKIASVLYDAGYRKKDDILREVFEDIEKYLAMFSHIHKYAREAQTSVEEYADGSPCEMMSVWDVLTLHKNGWDDYETMVQLQENIGNIEKDRLLTEFESDFAELRKKYLGE